MSDLDVGILKQEILSLLVSSKYGLSEHELLNDYRMFNSNKDLPYRDLGYSSLASLLRSWPDVCRLQQGNNGAYQILAVEEESTKHILSMVKGQRPGKGRRRTRGGRNRGRGGGGGDSRYTGRDNRGARFTENTFNSNNNSRPRGNYNRGAPNGRMINNNNNRSNPPPRAAIRQPIPTSNNRSNVQNPPRFNQFQQQQIRAYVTGASQPRMASYDARQTTNTNFLDDRRVINDLTSLRITVSNNTNDNNNNNHYQNSQDPAFRLSEYEVDEYGEQYDEEADREEEVINNIQMLLTEYAHGIRLLALDELYQKKFGTSLLTELKLANILLLQDYVGDFASISRHGEENGSCDHIITLLDPKQVAQTQVQLLQQITNSGIVPSNFRYANNLFSYINDSRFQGFVSNVDKNEHCIHIQPARYHEHIETLMEELDSYYSSSISNTLIIKNVETGLSCVTQYDGIYHRVFIKESDLYKCVIVYVDYGTTEEVNKEDQQFKYLVTHFAELPCMAIACRLDNVFFLPDDNQWPIETYKEVYELCKHGPLFIEPVGYMNGLVTIRISDADGTYLNDIVVVDLKLAVNIEKHSNNAAIEQYEQKQSNAPNPVELKFDFIDTARQCPLPDSRPSTPESKQINSEFKLSENDTNQQTDHFSDAEYQCKLITIDETNSFYLIRYNDNRPFIPCFSLAHLLNVSESDLLSETLMSRTRFQQTEEYRSIFDFLKQTNLTNCLHINQDFLFLFDLISTLKFLELHVTNASLLIETLRQQIVASSDTQYWKNSHDCYKPPKAVTPVPSAQSTNQKDTERYNELLANRNILCNLLRTNDITGCSVQLESIENELQSLVEKMRLGASSQQQIRNVPLTPPPGFTTKNNNDQQQQQSTVNKTDKLKDLMERCKTLINTILVLDDHVVIDENIIKYIQNNLPFINSGKISSNDTQLYKQYSELLQNLTFIVDDLRQKLPSGVNL